MNQERKPTGWWQSVPGMLTAMAALVAAISGLISGLNQVGAFDRFKRPPAPSAVPARGTTASSASGELADTGASRTLRQTPTAAGGTRAAPRQRPAAQAGGPPPTARASAGARDTSSITRDTSRQSSSGRAQRPAQADSATHAPPGGPQAQAPQPGAPPSAGATSQPSATPAPPATGGDSRAAAPPAPAGTLPSGTVLELASSTRVCSTTHEDGDRFPATVVVPVTGGSGVLLPVGTPVVLQVVELKPPSFLSARADSVVVSGRAYPLESEDARVQRELVAGAAGTGLGVGACIPAGGRITATLTRSVTLGGP